MLCLVQGFVKDDSRKWTKKRSSSNLSAKSAPPTPLDDRLAPVGGLIGHSPSYAGGLSSGGSGSNLVPPGSPSLAVTPPPSSSPALPLSPSHLFSKHDRQALKQLSTSAPAMTQASIRTGPASSSSSSTASAAAHCASSVTVSPVESAEPVVPTPGSSKARQKKFHRHFKQVAPEERVLNYYSCALIGDILLQGHLYITKNYFAFYSNVFGYVTKILIPTVSVLKVTKERTAKIIPNAVGVATEEDKHVFGSLLSRDTTYKLMVQVWRNARANDAVRKDSLIKPQVVKDEVDSGSGDGNLNDDDEEDEEDEEDEDSSGSGASGNESMAASCPSSPAPTPLPISTLKHIPATDVPVGFSSEGCAISKVNGAARLITPSKTGQGSVKDRGSSLLSLASKPSFILLVSTALLLLLFLSAAFLLYRISLIQNQFIENPLLSGSSDDVYQEILKWQNQLHSKSANEVQEFLNSNLDQIAKVRQSLEALALLIVPGEGEGDLQDSSSASRLGIRQQRRPEHGWGSRQPVAPSAETQDAPS